MNSDYIKLAQALFPEVTLSPEDLERRYPPRNLPPTSEVTRLGPSPTGFIHLGNLYSALANERLAHSTGGVFFLRVEDTDLKRQTPGAVEAIINSLRYFKINLDQGALIAPKPGQIDYGPYFQSQRKDIYHVLAKNLVERGLAYPCFCSEEKLEEIRAKQTEQKLNTGYYGAFAACREMDLDKVLEKIASSQPRVLRLRSKGQSGLTFFFSDQIMGQVELPENFKDIVLLKSDGIPTYHFAHAVDDHLMRTTTVVRGVEWLSSVPVHRELFNFLNFNPPKYAHTAQLMKLDGGSKRKLSKREDPESSLDYYRQEGYHPKATRVYLMTILNSNFEDWRNENPSLNLEDFPFELSKMGNSGILFDIQKLNDVSRNVFGDFTAEQIANFFRDWLDEFYSQQTKTYFEDEQRLIQIIRLNQGLMENRKRKDIVCASQLKELLSFYFDQSFIPVFEPLKNFKRAVDILKDYLQSMGQTNDSVSWFDNLKSIGQRYNYFPK
ncbi:MAG: glutamate--tRNA ligase, partial [Deltaproteobacteria bacterium]|nr:glutamate--tRNA ligase [Deltaproteobacteria bacterium]